MKNVITEKIGLKLFALLLTFILIVSQLSYAGDSIETIKQKAEAGNIDKQLDLAFYYKNIKENTEKAMHWYYKAAKSGSLPAYFNIGIHAINTDDIQLAINCFLKVSEKGEKIIANIAELNLGIIYEEGLGNITVDNEKAFSWYQKAANNENANAQRKLSEYYFAGKGGVVKNKSKGLYWLEKSAENGFLYSQLLLALDCEIGCNQKIDLEKMVYWYRKAAEQGDSSAAFSLGSCYEKGTGVQKNLKKAIYWYKKAAELDDENAQKALIRLQK